MLMLVPLFRLMRATVSVPVLRAWYIRGPPEPAALRSHTEWSTVALRWLGNGGIHGLCCPNWFRFSCYLYRRFKHRRRTDDYWFCLGS
jgi:hypothetical protein